MRVSILGLRGGSASRPGGPRSAFYLVHSAGQPTPRMAPAQLADLAFRQAQDLHLGEAEGADRLHRLLAVERAGGYPAGAPGPVHGGPLRPGPVREADGVVVAQRPGLAGD